MKFFSMLLTVLFFAGPAAALAGQGGAVPVGWNDNGIAFPQDHCFHANANEWVYFSGKVTLDGTRELGLMFTIFQLTGRGGGYTYPVLLGLCDLEENKFYRAQLFSQAGMAGVTAEGYPSIQSGDSAFVWSDPENLHLSSALETLDSVRLSLELDLSPTREVLLHGEDGFIPMGDGLPSGYYSLTNLAPSGGTIAIDGQQHSVTGGRIWMDHQWGDWTSAGYYWDWFSLRLDNVGALMLFQFRNAGDEVVGGNWTYRDQDGRVRYGTDFQVTAQRRFKIYPLDWTLTIPSLQAEFRVSPLFDDQGFPGLWEGLCGVSGRVGEEPLTGHAFVELTGYTPF